MKNKFNIIIVLVLFIAVILSAYFVGKKTSETKLSKIIHNTAFIKDIAELSSLEVNGTASIKKSNIENDGSAESILKKFFSENTIEIDIDYKAKYGVRLDSQAIQIEQKEQKAILILPQPQLLSFELMMDQLKKRVESGLFAYSSIDDFLKVQSELINKAHNILLNDTNYKQKAKQKINSIIEDYYAPLGIKVEVKYKDEINVSVTERFKSLQ